MCHLLFTFFFIHLRGLIPFISASSWFLVRSPNVCLAPWMKIARKTPNVEYVDHSHEQLFTATFYRVFDKFFLGLADILIKSPNVYLLSTMKEIIMKISQCGLCRPPPMSNYLQHHSRIFDDFLFSSGRKWITGPLCSEICYAHLVPVKIRNRGHTCNFQLVMHQLHSWVTRPSAVRLLLAWPHF